MVPKVKSWYPGTKMMKACWRCLMKTCRSDVATGRRSLPLPDECPCSAAMRLAHLVAYNAASNSLERPQLSFTSTAGHAVGHKRGAGFPGVVPW